MIFRVNRPTLHLAHRPPWLTAGAVVILATGLVPMGDSAGSEGAQAIVREGAVTATVSAAGTVQSADTRELVFGTAGTVTKVAVEPGDKVQAGQVLARLDDGAARDQVDVAEAALSSADDAYTQAEQGICAGGSGGGANGSANGGTTVTTVSAHHAGGSSGPARTRRTAPRGPRRTTSPTPTPSPTPTTPSPAPTPTPAPTHTLPTHTPTAKPTHTSRPTHTAKPTTRPRPTGGPGAGRGPGAGGGGRTGGARQGGPGGGTGGGCPAGAVEQASAKVTQAQVDVRKAKRALAATTLKAPIDGTVLSVAGTAGSHVTAAGTTGFVTLGDLQDLQVRAMFSLADVQRLRLGRQATIGLGMSAGRLRYTGAVTRIDPAATTNGRLAQFGVMIALDTRPSGLMVGMSASVEVVTARADDALYVPAGAVHPRPDGTATVLVRHGGRTVSRTVRLGVQGDRYVAITSGLSSGDRVVLPAGTGPDGYPDGTFPGR